VELISAHEALEFLGKSAPRPWVKRMLLWMIFTSELTPYFLKGKSVAKCMALAAVFQDVADGVSEEKARITVKERFSPELTDLILRADERGYVDYVACQWGESSDKDPRSVSTGYFVRADNLDWKNRILEVEISFWEEGGRDYFADEEELLTSEFEKADYKITLVGPASVDRVPGIGMGRQLTCSP